MVRLGSRVLGFCGVKDLKIWGVGGVGVQSGEISRGSGGYDTAWGGGGEAVSGGCYVAEIGGYDAVWGEHGKHGLRGGSGGGKAFRGLRASLWGHLSLREGLGG